MSDKTEQLLTQAEQLFAANLFAASALFFSKAEELERAEHRTTARPALGLARMEIAAGKFAEARRRLESLVAAFPQVGEAQTLLGVVEERAGNDAKALERYRLGASTSPEVALTHYNLGRMLGRQKQWMEAIRALERAVTLAPSNSGFLYTLGTVLQASGHDAEALQVMTQCVKIAPEFLDGYVTLADLLVASGHDDEADQLLEIASRKFPSIGVLHSKRAAICTRRNDLKGAIAHLERQAEVEPSSADVWLALATYRLAFLDFEKAEEACHRALRADPSDGRAHYQLGVIYDACRLNELARGEFQKAIALSPENWRPYNNLGTMLLEDKGGDRSAAAAQLFQKARDRANGTERIAPSYNLALAYYRMGNRKESERVAREVAAGPAGDPVVEDARRFLLNF